MAICTLLDGLIRSFMILASGGDLHFWTILVAYGITRDVLEWLVRRYCALVCYGVKMMNNKVIFGKD